MSNWMSEVDARTRLAGANKMELLLFHLGREELYGINVFKVREVMKIPPLTHVPEADGRIEGMTNLRGVMVPVIHLAKALALPPISGDGEEGAGHLIIAEYNNVLQGLHVAHVDRIIRMSWEQVKPPPKLVRNFGGKSGGAVTAVTTLEDSRTVLILDVEKILAEICPKAEEELFLGVPQDATLKGLHMVYADDSHTARKQIAATLDRVGMTYECGTTGLEAWNLLKGLADKAKTQGKSVRDVINIILTDIEMPEMDGFTLTKNIRSDPRFEGIPVLMHSSLTGSCNVEKGRAVGVTDYVTKFDPKQLVEKISTHALKPVEAGR